MLFNIGDVVLVQRGNAVSRARIQSVLPPTLSVQDFQEYVVEFMNFRSERFHFGLCREFEMRLEARAAEPGVEIAGSC